MQTRLINLAGRLAGGAVLAIGLSHFVMPSWGYAADDIAAVPDLQRDHFVYLGTYAIGSFLVSFGALSLIADARRGDRFETVFFGLMTAVWAGRLGLEAIYPVDLPLFFLARPHAVLSAAIALIFLGYAIGFAGRLALRRPASHPAGGSPS